tara:strand:+ start:282 stop:764 length:483 start_codon:yes stop_codon:yes gene_type:complete
MNDNKFKEYWCKKDNISDKAWSAAEGFFKLDQDYGASLPDLARIIQDAIEDKVEPDHSNSPIGCNHANESPAVCPCDINCYCRVHGNCPLPQKIRYVKPGYKNLGEPCPDCGSTKYETCCKDAGSGFDTNDTSGIHWCHNTVNCKECGVLLEENGNCKWL